MCDPLTKRGVLNDFDLARWGAPDRKPSAKDNTGTLPFLALDLLNERALDGSVPRLYRHDAESFTWCLIYICVCMIQGTDGRISTRRINPLSDWSVNLKHCLYSKTRLAEEHLLDNFPIHRRIEPLASDLYDCWASRYFKHMGAGLKRGGEPYNELSNEEWFKQVFQLFLDATDAIPESKRRVFEEMTRLVTSLNPFVVVEPSESAAGTSI